MNRMRQEISRAALAPAVVTADAAEQRFQFDEDFIGFAGHFPGYPILPAILQTLLAQQLAEQLAGGSLDFRGLEKAKFFRQLRPGEEIRVKVVFRGREKLIRCAAELFGAGESAATFVLLFGEGATA
jgi:3-hydroxyacyl-[acyl-carrier-protein] dehydratase